MASLFRALLFFLFIFLNSNTYTARAENTPATGSTVTTPILSLWRDPRAFLVVQTGYGEFFYPYDAAVEARDGTGRLRLVDPGGALLGAILAAADGRPVALHVSDRARNVLVGLGDVRCSLTPVAQARPAAAGVAP